jgi:hypothetical protein
MWSKDGEIEEVDDGTEEGDGGAGDGGSSD